MTTVEIHGVNMINETKRAAIADKAEYDVTCAVNGNLLIREMTFPYAAPQWDARVSN